jgi:hypothetical protein
VSTAKAQRLILEHLRSGDTVLLSVHMELPEVPVWCDGRDAAGRAVILIGGHALRALPGGEDAIAAVLAEAAAGYTAPGVHSLTFQPAASAALAEIVAGQSTEVCCWGSRGSGKTILAAAAQLILAEMHARSGHVLPHKTLWLHSSLTDASKKTGESLEESMWAGTWSLEEGRSRAIGRVGGHVFCVIDFVGTQDIQAQDRVRASAHSIIAEEAVATLDAGGGIPARAYEVGLTSMMRLPGRRRVGVVTTNPGHREHWVYERFIAAEHDPKRVAMHVPSSDRLTEAEIAAQGAPFAASSDLRARLVDEQWVDLQLGPVVAKGFNVRVHVAKAPLAISEGADLWLGWDSAPNAHCHALVVAQRLGGRAGLTMVRIYAALVAEETGLKQFLESAVVPWFARRAPLYLQRGWGERIFHCYDPACDNREGGDYDVNPIMRIRKALGGGSMRPGPTDWQGRSGPMLAMFNMGAGNGEPALQICPGTDTEPLRRALGGVWYYGVTRGGQIVADLPFKPNHPHEDVGDAFCYLIAGMAPSRPQRLPGSSRVLGIVQDPFRRRGA